MEPLDAIAAASTTFVGVLDQVGTDRLGAATPCAGWDVRDLLGHVIAGDRMAVALWDGATAEEAGRLLDQSFGDDAVDLCRISVSAQLDRARAVTEWDAIVHHVVGDVPAAQLLQFRIGDLTLHAWDLATALGTDLVIPDELADGIYESLQPMAPFIGELGIFGTGPSGDVGGDAPIVTRLLDFTGRRP